AAPYRKGQVLHSVFAAAHCIDRISPRGLLKPDFFNAGDQSISKRRIRTSLKVRFYKIFRVIL
ncbi:MAG: hypothetical protein ACTIOG_15980, partial [Pseudomonas helleri]